jgi:hypothetical protein
MLHHFRFIQPLLTSGDDGLSSLHYYDSAIQLARTSRRELTEDEFELGMEAAEDISKSCVFYAMQTRNRLAYDHYEQLK